MSTEEQDAVFVSLVQSSWKRYNEMYYNARIDDMLIGGVITATVEGGYSLIDLTSNGRDHNLRFEDFKTRDRLLFQLTHLSEDLMTAKVLGRHARVKIGYGQIINNIGAIWQALKSEFKSAFMDSHEPGIITVDADVAAGYIYAQVGLIFELDQYFANKGVNYALMQSHILGTVAALKKYLVGRISK
jgi:hypothetical protein